MITVTVQHSSKQLKSPVLIIPVELVASLTEQWPVLKKIKPKDYPEASSSRSWDCLDEGLLIIITHLDLIKTKDQNHFSKIIQSLNENKINKATLFFGSQPVELARIIARLIVNATFVFDDYLTNKKPKFLKEITIIGKDKSLQTYVDQGVLIGQAMHFTRTLAEMPPNVCTPSYLAKKAQELGKKYKKIQVSVLGQKELETLKMNSFLSVAQGSNEPAKFITLHYKGSKKAPLVFIGKGITFDTGGHSLKPAASMMGMKFDMSGAATVLGLFEFLAHYEPELSVIGLIPTCENIPGGSANKPDNIVTSLSGQTIEILNTDAEGRLILCDAMTYAERFEPSYVIDIATLTGACLATFGTIATGIMGNDDTLITKLMLAATQSTDKAWTLPLWEEYQELLKSPVADMANIGDGHAGTITAGCFLSRFAKSYKWAHLDIAGTACVFQGHKRGSTGRPLPLLIEFILNELNI
jgi:leucyl aminopeptidase